MSKLIVIEAPFGNKAPIEFKILDGTGDALQITTVFNADAQSMPRHTFERKGRLILTTHESLADKLAEMF